MLVMKTELKSLMVNSKNMEPIEEFCYLGSILMSSGNCRKKIHARIAEADSAFNKLNNIFRGRKLGLPIKIQVYNYSIVKAVLLYSAETWPMTKAEIQHLEAAHHKWLRRIINISWKDMVHNDSVREQTSHEQLVRADRNVG